MATLPALATEPEPVAIDRVSHLESQCNRFLVDRNGITIASQEAKVTRTASVKVSSTCVPAGWFPVADCEVHKLLTSCPVSVLEPDNNTSSRSVVAVCLPVLVAQSMCGLRRGRRKREGHSGWVFDKDLSVAIVSRIIGFVCIRVAAQLRHDD